jgi:hypothetical protein
MNQSRSTIEIELEDDLLFKLMLRAHEQDITLNQLIDQILREYIIEYERSGSTAE